MGFWDGVAKVGKAVMEEAQRSQQQRERQLENAHRRASGVSNDRDLVNRFQNASGADKAAYGLELANRGYLERGEDGKFRRTNKTL
ncbi:hypothetical protein J9317_18485 [Metabacillus sp. KIGAM252]|uniref:Uncharacterized protein n=1 Tax=Metabacillus flavus TaxID=2823519 RepID=A0ABS5LIZ8_9BACI|nr:hypothetical protein [Metabacillus flavus]MBS2970735.1 hypothetical protein [Metabacillus flavus]